MRMVCDEFVKKARSDSGTCLSYILPEYGTRLKFQTPPVGVSILYEKHTCSLDSLRIVRTSPTFCLVLFQLIIINLVHLRRESYIAYCYWWLYHMNGGGTFGQSFHIKFTPPIKEGHIVGSDNPRRTPFATKSRFDHVEHAAWFHRKRNSSLA